MEDHSDAMHFEDFLAEQFAAEEEPDDDDIEQFGDVIDDANSSVLDVLNSGTLEDDDVTFISKDIFESMIDLEAQKTMKSEKTDENSHLEDLEDALCSVCWKVTDGSAVQCENKNDCESERGWYHQPCVDFNEWENELKKKVEKYLKVKTNKKEIKKLNKVENFINDCKKLYLEEDCISNTNFEKSRWEWKTKYPYFCPRKSSIW